MPLFEPALGDESARRVDDGALGPDVTAETENVEP